MALTHDNEIRIREALNEINCYCCMMAYGKNNLIIYGCTLPQRLFDR